MGFGTICFMYVSCMFQIFGFFWLLTVGCRHRGRCGFLSFLSVSLNALKTRSTGKRFLFSVFSVCSVVFGDSDEIHVGFRSVSRRDVARA